MKINEELVNKLAHLSKLTFADSEKIHIANDLQNMIGFVEKLNELNLDNVTPLMHMSDEINALREDQIQGTVSSQEALANVPETDGSFFLVPKVIKK